MMVNALHVSANTYPPLTAGEHNTKNIWRELSQGFDEYHIFARSEDNTFSRTRMDNITLHLIPRITRRSWIFVFTSIYLFLLVKRNRITHIIAQSALLGGFSAALASRLFKIPLWVEIHGDVYFRYLERKTLTEKFLAIFVSFTFYTATRVRSLSSAMSDSLDTYGFRDNVVVVPNRVNLELFECPRRNYALGSPVRIISIGRFVEQKGYDIAIRAISQLSSRYSIELYLVGGGPLSKQLHYECKSVEGVKLFDWIEQAELQSMMRSADIYIQPSKPFLGEAMPRTILEAMAMRLPIIASKIAAIPGILNDGNAILIEPCSVSALVSALERLILDKQLRENLGEQAWNDASNYFNWDDSFEMYRRRILAMKY